jgi:hypothetical protein
MNCQRARRLLSDRLDGPLSPPEATALTAHLRDCAACAQYEAQLRAQMGRIARLPDLPLPASAARAARPTPSAFGVWLTRGTQLAGALLAVLLVARLTAGLLRPRAEQLERPLPTPRTLGFGPSAAPESAHPANAFFAPATPPTATVATPQPLTYTRTWTLSEQDQLWGQVASAQGEAIGAILRPGYLPDGLQRAQIGQIQGETGHFAVSFTGDGSRQVRIAAGLQPAQLYPAATLAAAPHALTTVRGQSATLFGPIGADGGLALTWTEPGRWAAHGGLFGTDRIPYTISVQGYERAELEHIATSLAPQLSAPNAVDVVRRYYAAINERNYQAAYALFDPSWQQNYEDFANGFADTARDEIDILGVIAADTPGRYFVQIRLLASRTDGGHQWYSGTYEIGGPPGSARILDADVAAPTDDQATQLAPKGPPACTDAQLGLVLHPQLIESGRVVDILVGITNTGVPCRLATPLTVTITAANGQTLTLDGNALTLTPSGAIDTANLGIDFQWTNWCGDPGPFTLHATLGTKTAERPIDQPPSCTAPGTQSQLEWR